MIRLATSEGLFDLDDSSGDTTAVPSVSGRGVRALGGAWAVLDDGSVITLDGASAIAAAAFDGVVPWCVAELDADGAALVGTSAARVFRVTSTRAEPVTSFDAIPTRDEWYTPWGAPPDTRSLSVTPEGEVMVNVHVGGIWAGLADGAGGWEPVVEVDADVHQVAAAPEGRVVVAAAAIGCGISHDGGHGWTWSADGLHASYCRAVAVAGDIVLVTASTGPNTRSGAVYRRSLVSAPDRPFLRCDDGLPESFPYNLDTFTLAASGADVALGTRDGDVFRSADHGSTWVQVGSGLPPIRAVAFG